MPSKACSDAWNHFNNENTFKCKMCSTSLPQTKHYNENTILTECILKKAHSQHELKILTSTDKFTCAFALFCADVGPNIIFIVYIWLISNRMHLCVINLLAFCYNSVLTSANCCSLASAHAHQMAIPNIIGYDWI